jgi:hypothetical protein
MIIGYIVGYIQVFFEALKFEFSEVNKTANLPKRGTRIECPYIAGDLQ